MSNNTTNDLPTNASWETKPVTLKDGKVIYVFTIPSSNGHINYILPQTPGLVHSSSGEPVFSLSLILRNQPTPEQDNIHALIESGILTLDVKIGVSEDILDAVSASWQVECRRLFARKIEYGLLWSENDIGSPIVMTQAEASGSEGRAGISAHLNRAQVLELLTSLDENPSHLYLSSTVHYQTSEGSRSVQISGSWADIYDFLKNHLNEDSKIKESSLYQLVSAMAENGLLIVTGDGKPIQLPVEDLMRIFMRQAAVVLRKESEPDNGEDWFTLRPRPYEGFRLSYTESITTAGMKTLELHTPLHQIIGGALEGYNWTDYVHLLAKQPDNPSAYSPIPKKVRASRSQHADRRESNNIKMAAIDNSLVSLSLATRPGIHLTSRPNLESSHLPEGMIYKRPLDDFIINIKELAKNRSLPVINNREAPYWSDRIDSGKFWYAPVFEIVEPEPNADPSSSSFLFSFERFGATSTGEPALRGNVHFTLLSDMSAETESALDRDNRISKAQPVSFENFSVSLLVPFVDISDGQVKQHTFEATVQKQGDTLSVDVPVLNEWVRLTYGALAIEGFQTLPPQVLISYTFKGYVPIKDNNFELIFGGKSLRTPITYSAIEASNLKGTTYFDAINLTYVQPREEIHYKPELAGLIPRKTLDSEIVKLAKFKDIAGQPLHVAIASVKPNLAVSASVASIVKEVKYSLNTELRQQKQTLVFPCNRLGNFYQEIRNGTPVPIGCQDAFKLGQIRYNQYEEINELTDSAYKVYRSLQQPEHFLVLPASFCINRREAGEKDAYRPLIFLNAIIDAAVSANNRVELRVTLEPDLPLFKRSALLEKLKAYSQNPVIHYPTDIPAEAVNFNWLIDSSITANSEADVLEVDGPFITAYFGMNLANWQLMRSVLSNPGINGSVSFTLADGSRFSSNLLLKLDHIRGPWQNGPLEIVAQNEEVNITNCIESTIDISDLVRYVGDKIAEQVPVEVSLIPGKTHKISAGSGLQPVYSYPPGDPVAIKETRSFVEDIYSNLIFINLLNFNNHNLLQLNVEARLQGLDSLYKAQLTEDMRVADIPVVLPLTTYLENRLLDFRVIKIFKDREAESTDWIQWDMETSVPISLTREILGL
ncbi:MAG: hypothetical protein ACPK85_04320 [Methanosarcina sp.]